MFSMKKITFIFLIVFCLLITNYYFLSAPNINKTATTIHIAPNTSLVSISEELEARNVVRSALTLKVLVSFLKSDTQIARGDYLFEKNLPVYKVAWQLASSRHGISPIKITFKEGITNNQIADILATKLSGFRRDLFMADPRTKEGYLFPDTYFFFQLTTASEIVDEFSNNFNNQISSLGKDIQTSNRSLSDIIIMASIIEKEARGKSDASMISGILWKRILLGMPLQADAAPITYKQKGLPSEAINNPGLVSINASINPTDSPYLFYLHDKNGMVHYAKDFREHRQNIVRYLK